MDNSFKTSFHPSLLYIDRYPFMSTPSPSAICDDVNQFIRRVVLREKLSCCIVCSREVQASFTETVALNEIPNIAFLRPREVHVDHELINGALIHFPAVVNDGYGAFGSVCRQCMRCLSAFVVPSISIAAGHWVGDLAAPLMDLTLAEQLLVARQPAASYIIHSPTFPLNLEDAIGLNDDTHINAPPAVLTTMPMTLLDMKSFFKVQISGNGFTTIPDCLRVNRSKVDAALQWLKGNSPHYSDIVISRSRLSMLPISGIPAVLAIHLKNGSTDASPARGEVVRAQFDVTIHKMIEHGQDMDDHVTRTKAFSWMFPWAFPRALSGLTWVDANMSDCSRWLLQNYSNRFRTDEVLVSKLYELVIVEKIRTVLSIRQDVLQHIMDEYTLGPSREETHAALARGTTCVLENVAGTNAARSSISRKFWSIALMKGPPTFHLEIGLLENISCHPLSGGVSTASPRDPYPGVRKLNNAVTCLLEDLLGIKSTGSLNGVDHREGVLGKVAAYVTSIRPVSTGGLAVHIAIWITNSPTFHALKTKLGRAEFRKMFAAYCARAFQNLDPSGDCEDGRAFTKHDVDPLMKAARNGTSSRTYSWNADLMKAAKVHVEARLLVGAADYYNVANFIGASIFSGPGPSIAEEVSAAIELAKPTASGDLDIASKLVESTAKSMCLSREMGHSMQIHYLMGWTDARSSHTFVEINLDSIRSFMVLSNPDLKPSVLRESAVSSQVLDMGAEPQEDDFLGDYAARGWTMTEHNLLEFCLTSMEAKDSHLAYRKRWRYMLGTGRDARSRVTRLLQAMPYFVGRWFPRNDTRGSQDLNRAMTMCLLVPWRDAASIRNGYKTWEAAYEVFHADATPTIIQLIENMQLFHDCQDAASSQSSSSDR